MLAHKGDYVPFVLANYSGAFSEQVPPYFVPDLVHAKHDWAANGQVGIVRDHFILLGYAAVFSKHSLARRGSLSKRFVVAD